MDQIGRRQSGRDREGVKRLRGTISRRQGKVKWLYLKQSVEEARII